MATVWIPSLLRPLAGGQDKLQVEGSNLRQVIDALDALHPGFKERLLFDAARLRPEIAAAIDGNTEHLGLLEPVRPDTEIHFVPSIAGGSRPF